MSGNLRLTVDIENEIKVMGKLLMRLRSSFTLEKDEALVGGNEKLVELRERSRTHYQPLCGRMLNDVQLLRYRSSRAEDAPSSIFARMDKLEKAIKETLAHFSGTPNRLLRSPGQNAGDD